MVIKNTYILYFEPEHYLLDNSWMKVYETEIDGESYYFSENKNGKLNRISSELFKSTLKSSKKLLRK